MTFPVILRIIRVRSQMKAVFFNKIRVFINVITRYSDKSYCSVKFVMKMGCLALEGKTKAIQKFLAGMFGLCVRTFQFYLIFQQRKRLCNGFMISDRDKVRSSCGYLYDGGDNHGEDDGTLERVERLWCPGDSAHAAEEQKHGCAHCFGEEYLDSLPGQPAPVPTTRHLCATINNKYKIYSHHELKKLIK